MPTPPAPPAAPKDNTPPNDAAQPKDNTQPAPPAAPKDNAPPPAAGEDVATLKAELEALKAEREKAAADKMTEAEQLRAELEALRTTVDATKADALKHARAAALSRLGVLPEYQDFAPADADPRTAEGRAALEKWAADRPAMLNRQPPQPVRQEVTATAIFGEKGKGNAFITPESFAANAKALGLN